MKGTRKKPEVTPELIEACKKYKETSERIRELEEQQIDIYREQRAPERIIERFVKKSVRTIKGITIKAGKFKIRASGTGYIRKVS